MTSRTADEEDSNSQHFPPDRDGHEDGGAGCSENLDDSISVLSMTSIDCYKTKSSSNAVVRNDFLDASDDEHDEDSYSYYSSSSSSSASSSFSSSGFSDISTPSRAHNRLHDDDDDDHSDGDIDIDDYHPSHRPAADYGFTSNAGFGMTRRRAVPRCDEDKDDGDGDGVFDFTRGKRRRSRRYDYAEQNGSDSDGYRSSNESPYLNPTRGRKGRYRRRRYTQPNIVSLQRFLITNRSSSTILLFASIAVWIIVQLHTNTYTNTRTQPTLKRAAPAPTNDSEQKTIKAQRLRGHGLKNKPPSRQASVGDATWRAAHNALNGLAKQFSSFPSDADAIPEGCELEEWQQQHLPNCNDIHEVDMMDFLAVANPKKFRSTLHYDAPGYLGKGMWRSVWQITPRYGLEPFVTDRVAIKFMKLEHDVEPRNFERHRREAMVMEHFTSSPHVVSIYGYCGNTVMTEYIPQDLEIHLQQMSADENTAERRLDLALGVSRAIATLHSNDRSPTVHADLQAKQFLIDADGHIKVNDFNRCRFISHKNGTDEKCALYIPTAPGRSRSPEEYSLSSLDEKLDVYSLANVLYLILTGRKAWADFGFAAAKKQIQRGKMPAMPTSGLQPADIPLANLIAKAYTYDPKQRISAADLVAELEKLQRTMNVQKVQV